MNLLLDSFLVMVVAIGEDNVTYQENTLEISQIPVVEENQLEVLSTNSNSIAEEGRARLCGSLLAFQNVKVLSHLYSNIVIIHGACHKSGWFQGNSFNLVCIKTLALGGFQLNDVSVKPGCDLYQ